MRITKFKRTKSDKIYIAYEKENDNGDWDKYTLRCADDPKPEMFEALEELRQDVVQICELQQGTETVLDVTGVSFSYSDGIMGAVITAQKTLMTANAPLNINTPSLPAQPYGEGNEQPILPPETVSRLENLKNECELYIEGDRKQMSLFNDNQDNEDLPDDPDFYVAEDEEEPVGGEVVSRNFN